MVKASLIIPTHNVAPYLETCLHSALGQTLRDVEIIIVDDASTDETPAIIARFAQRHANIRPILFAENKGVSAARNAALDAAEGEWIALLDSDDWMDAERLETLVRHGEALGADWIADDQHFIFDGKSTPCGRLIADEPVGATMIDAVHVVRNDPPGHLGYGLLKPIIRRRFLTDAGLRYRPELRRYEDFLFLLQCAANGARLALLNEPHYWYRLRSNSLTKWDPVLIGRENLKVSALAREVAQAHGLADLEKALLSRDRAIERNIRYYQVMTPIKARRWREAIGRLVSDPIIAADIFSNALERLQLRLSKRGVHELLLLSHARRHVH